MYISLPILACVEIYINVQKFGVFLFFVIFIQQVFSK